MKREYASPELVEFGTVAELTAALGEPSREDTSEFAGIESGMGSFDVCRNEQPAVNC